MITLRLFYCGAKNIQKDCKKVILEKSCLEFVDFTNTNVR